MNVANGTPVLELKSNPPLVDLAPKADLLSAFGLDPAEIDSEIELTRSKKLSKAICLCGHPNVRHNDRGDGIYSCFISGMYCPCSAPMQVLIAQDTRCFAYRTTSSGKGHALSKGIRAAQKGGQILEFSIEPICFVCQQNNVHATPVPFNRAGYPTNQPGFRNALICEACLSKLKGH